MASITPEPIGMFLDKKDAYLTFVMSFSPTKLGNPLEKIRKAIDFEVFRADLEAHILNHNKKSNVGCRPFDVVLMFNHSIQSFLSSKRQTGRIPNCLLKRVKS